MTLSTTVVSQNPDFPDPAFFSYLDAATNGKMVFTPSATAPPLAAGAALVVILLSLVIVFGVRRTRRTRTAAQEAAVPASITSGSEGI